VPEVKTFLRATLRYPDFCKGWNALIKLGLTDEQDNISELKTYHDWTAAKTGYTNNVSLKEHVANLLAVKPEDKIIDLLEWMGIFSEQPIPDQPATSAELLLKLLLNKWEMKPDDKDMVVMQHEVEYLHRNKKIKLTSSMVLKGENREYSAMAKTVGLPMGILARIAMNKKLPQVKGVHIPNMPSIYRPVMTELHHHGIHFVEEVE
jgi:saccharopine dehydrogenase (NADP+, L-glutamate forming)